MSKGTLHLMPVPLHMEGMVTFAQTNGADALAVLHSAQYFVAENARTARRMLATLGLGKPISELNIVEIPRDPKPQDWQTLLGELVSGEKDNPKADAALAEDIKNRLLSQAADEPDDA